MLGVQDLRIHYRKTDEGRQMDAAAKSNGQSAIKNKKSKNINNGPVWRSGILYDLTNNKY